MMTSSDLASELQRLKLELSNNPTNPSLSFEYAKKLYANGQVDEAFRTLKKTVAYHSKDHKVVDEARQITHEFMSKATNKYNGDPKELLKRLNDCVDVGEEQLEDAKLLQRLCHEPSIAGQLIRMGYLSAGFNLIFKELTGTQKEAFFGIVCQALSELIKNSEPNDLHSIILRKHEIKRIISVYCTGELSAFLNMISCLCQKTKLDDYSDETVSFLHELIEVTIKHDDLNLGDMSISLLIRTLPSMKLCKKWVDSGDHLVQLLMMSNRLLQAKKIEYGHVSILLGKLFQVASENEYLEKQLRDSFFKIIRNRLEGDEKAKNDGIRLMSVILTINTNLGAEIFSADGNVDIILDCLEYEPQYVQISALQLLSDACADANCRKKIRSECMAYLEHCLRDQSDLKTLSAAVLSKLSTSDTNKSNLMPEQDAPKPRDLAKTLTGKLGSDKVTLEEKVMALEGLSYVSTFPDVKEIIMEDLAKLLPEFIRLFDTDLKSSTSESSKVYGLALLMDNLTGYKRKRSEEEEQLQKLRVYCKDALPDDNDPRLSDAAVEEWNRKLVSHPQFLKLLTKLSQKTKSPRVAEHLGRCWVSLATDAKLRGILVQAGAVKLLLALSQIIDHPDASSFIQPMSETVSDPDRLEGRHYAIQALAKIAISVDPHLAFPSTAPTLVKPLLSLVDTHNQLMQFESLLALTNLCSMEESRVGEVAKAIRNKFRSKEVMRKVEDLILSEHPRIQCASCELLCNLVADENLAESWLAERGAVRMKILLALADSELVGTRMGTTGALAMLLQIPKALDYAFEFERAPEILRQMVFEETDENVLWRSLFVCNVVSAASEEKAKLVVGSNGEKWSKALNKFIKSSSPQIREYSKLLKNSLFTK